MGLVWATCKTNVLGIESDEEDDEDYDNLSDSGKSASPIRDSRLQMFFKIGFFKNFATFIAKQETPLIKLQVVFL